jgi:hypothetical protein
MLRTIMAACIAILPAGAIALPSSAAASSWAVIGTTHSLTSTNLTFTAHLGFGTIGSSCATSRFDADVLSASTLTITNATFVGCTGTGAAADCTITKRGTSFPWRLTILLFRWDNAHMDEYYEDKPGGPPCNGRGATSTWVGDLSGGDWDPLFHQLTYANATGMTASSAFGHGPATVTGTIRDDTQTLTVN